MARHDLPRFGLHLIVRAIGDFSARPYFHCVPDHHAVLVSKTLRRAEPLHCPLKPSAVDLDPQTAQQPRALGPSEQSVDFTLVPQQIDAITIWSRCQKKGIELTLDYYQKSRA